MTTLEFHIKNYIDNLKFIKTMIKNKLLCLVLKSNAYGFGLENIMPLIMTTVGNVDYIAITENSEAAMIRKYSNTIKIIRLKPANIMEIQAGLRYNIEEILDTTEKIKLIQEHFPEVPVHLSIDRGMNNMGLRIEDVQVNILRGLNVVGFMSHFPSVLNIQTDNALYHLLDKIKALFPAIISHFCNSKNVIRNPDSFGDMIRIGNLSYGMSRTFKFLKPVLLWFADTELTTRRSVRKDESIGYGSTYTAKNDMTLLIINCGFNNGYPAYENNTAYVLVNNEKCKIVGKISMNLLHVDISPIKNNTITSICLLGRSLYIEDLKSNEYYNDGQILLNIARSNIIRFI